MFQNADRLIAAAKKLRDEAGALHFSPPVTHVYNPLTYAWSAHEEYLKRFGAGTKRVVFLGMNPGPFGMVQTGVPFGEICAVRDWMHIQVPILRPDLEHPRRLIQGFDCKRSEISGKRLWGLFARRFGAPENFFTNHFVVNYCPLAFLVSSGANFTPDKLPAREARALTQVCDRHLQAVIKVLEPEWVIGVGAFAAQRARDAVGDLGFKIAQILHPSPASPAANREWDKKAAEQLFELGVWDRAGGL